MVLYRTLLCFTLITLVACTGLVEQNSAADDEFYSYLQKWRLAAIENYDMHYQPLCYCLPEHQRRIYLQVRSGQIVSAVYADNKERLDPSVDYDLKSVSDLFDLIDEAMAKPAAELVVSYDDSLGYPTSIYIDYYARMVDDEITVSDIGLIRVD